MRPRPRIQTGREMFTLLTFQVSHKTTTLYPMKHDFAVTVTWEDGAWRVRSFKDDFSSVATSLKAVRNLRTEGAAFAMLCVDDDYFVLVRPTPKRAKFLLSDATAAVEDDFAAEVLDELEIDVPDLDDDELEDAEPWAEGDFDIFEDLGMSEQVLSVICDETDWWASEQLQRIAEELGFEDEFADAVDLD